MAVAKRKQNPEIDSDFPRPRFERTRPFRRMAEACAWIGVGDLVRANLQQRGGLQVSAIPAERRRVGFRPVVVSLISMLERLAEPRAVVLLKVPNSRSAPDKAVGQPRRLQSIWNAIKIILSRADLCEHIYLDAKA